MPTIHIVYHRADMDGFSSCAIFKWSLENKYLRIPFKEYHINLIPFNYGFYFPFHTIQEEDLIIMVDISLPVDEMYILFDTVKGKFIWIDHHETVLNELKDFKSIGERNTEYAACKLSFDWIRNNLTAEGKKLGEDFWESLNRVYSYFDVYDKYEKTSEVWEDALTMNYLFNAIDIDPKNNEIFWNDIWLSCEENKVDELIEDFISDGILVRKGFESYNFQLVKAYGFEAEFEGLKMFFVNRGIGGSAVFSGIDTKKYDAVCCFVYSGKKDLYSFSFYSENSKTDLTPIFMKYNGGGHKGAGGIRVKSFKFDASSKKIELFP